MARTNIPLTRDAAALASLLASPEIAALITDLAATRWTGRKGYPVRAMVGMMLVKTLNCLPTWTRTVRLVADHAGSPSRPRLRPLAWTPAIGSPASCARTTTV